jgi:hypothetical protein
MCEFEWGRSSKSCPIVRFGVIGQGCTLSLVVERRAKCAEHWDIRSLLLRIPNLLQRTWAI